jgi:hypothetical protein
MTTKKTATDVALTAPKKISVKKTATPKTKVVAKPEAAAPVIKIPRAEPVAKKPKKELRIKEPKIKESKVKVVRDSFTMPQDEYLKIAEIKEAALQAGVPVKKSEVLRAGLKALVAMSPAQLKRALAGLEKIKTGRPKKH